MQMTKVEELVFRVVADNAGAYTMALGYIGDQLGLFRAMAGAGPLTSADVATRANLNERYTREWLRGMVASEYLEYDPATNRYHLTDEQAMVLADEDSPAFVGGAFHFATPSLYNVPRVMDAFRRGGGIPYGEIGGDIGCAMARFFRPGYKHSLVQSWLPAVPGLVDRLTAGIAVADVGCGRGQSTVHMAEAFPRSRFLGIDYHEASIAAALKTARDMNLTNVQFLQLPADAISRDLRFDLVCSFDCIHDMVDPLATLLRIRDVLADGGVYVWAEPNASDNPLENRNPLGRLCQTVSPLHCLTVSLAHDGAGLGTVIGERGVRDLARQAGFSSCERLAVNDPFNQLFALRK